MSGQLRHFDWLEDPLHPLTDEVHAYISSGPIPFRGACGRGRWTIKPVRAERGPLCQVCKEIVAGAAFRSLEQIAELEGRPAPITRAGVA